jgi:hypothetical protein
MDHHSKENMKHTPSKNEILIQTRGVPKGQAVKTPVRILW